MYDSYHLQRGVLLKYIPWDNDNDNDKAFYSTLIIHFVFNTAIDAFAY